MGQGSARTISGHSDRIPEFFAMRNGKALIFTQEMMTQIFPQGKERLRDDFGQFANVCN
jgi:hypothetical protein